MKADAAVETGGLSRGRAWPSVGHPGFAVALLAALAVLFAISRYNYLLFHSLIELGAVTVAWSVLLLVWNARRLEVPAGFLMLGIAYAYVGGLDLLHTLAYEGMLIFGRGGADLATQLWIAARYLEAAALLLFPLTTVLRMPVWTGVAGFTGAVVLLLSAIFLFNAFPVCFQAEHGLTPFKKLSEYAIIAALCAAVFLTWRLRRSVGESVGRLLVAAIVLTILSEFSFTLYEHPYGFPNMTGHLLKFASFWLLYRALIVDGLERPLEILGRRLHRESERYARIIDTAVDGFWVLDGEGRVLEANKAAARMLGYEPEELVGMGVSDIDATETVEQIARNMQLLKERGHDRFEKRHRRKDGRIIDVDVSCSVLPGPDGHIVSFSRDITDRKRSEARFRLQADLLDQVSDAIIATDMELRITAWNLAAERIYGWSEAEAKGRKIDDLLRTRWVGEAPERAQATLMETGCWKGEVRQRSRDGAPLTVEAAVSWILDADGKRIGGVTVNRDMTRRKQFEEALKRSEQKYRQLVDQSIQGLIVARDAPLRIDFASEPMAAITGYAPAELTRLNETQLIGLIHPDDRDRCFSSFRARLRGEAVPVRNEYRTIRRDGAVRWVETYTTLIRYDGRPAVQAAYVDITERKELRLRLMESSERERKKLAQELHDGLCQDLKGLEIEAALLEDRITDIDPEASKLAASLGRQVNDSVRKAYAIARGMLPVELDAKSFGAALSEMALQAGRQANIRITIDVREALTPPGEEYAFQLYRIAQEALANAIRHAGAGEISLNWGEEDGRPTLSIRDDGVGVDAGRLHESRGMGMTVMQTRAQSVGARLNVRSRAGGGTRVWVTLPVLGPANASEIRGAAVEELA